MAPRIRCYRFPALLAAALGLGSPLALGLGSPLALTTPAPPASDPAAAAAAGLDYEALLRDQASILVELDRLDGQITEHEAELQGLQDRRQQVAVRTLRLEVQFEAATRELVSAREQVRERLRAFLAAERFGRLDLALDPEADAEREQRQRVVRALLEADRRRVEAYRERLERWRAELEVLQAQRAELDDLERGLAATRDALEGERSARAAILERIRTDRRFFEKAHADAARAHADLADRIRRLEVWQDKQLRFAAHKGQFRLPMSYARVVTPFGTRKNAKLGTSTVHPGMEIASQGSTTVRAVFWGRVAHVGWVLGYGRTVILDHTEGYHTVYARLDEIEVEPGDVVESRQSIGTIGGASALGTPNTLLFELRHRGEAIDPAAWFR